MFWVLGYLLLVVKYIVVWEDDVGLFDVSLCGEFGGEFWLVVCVGCCEYGGEEVVGVCFCNDVEVVC